MARATKVFERTALVVFMVAARLKEHGLCLRDLSIAEPGRKLKDGNEVMTVRGRLKQDFGAWRHQRFAAIVKIGYTPDGHCYPLNIVVRVTPKLPGDGTFRKLLAAPRHMDWFQDKIGW
ncbi:MAG: hypothetical protein Q7R83_01705 [bacterium]|nr:hypothetical protein [bacterium]